MKVNVELCYEAPLVEVIEVEVEKGFAGSINENNTPTWDGEII